MSEGKQTMSENKHKTTAAWAWRYFLAAGALLAVSTVALGLGWLDAVVWGSVNGGAFASICGGHALKKRGVRGGER